MTRPNHNRDEDCVIDDTGCCRDCGVSQGEPCQVCGGRSFHRSGCVESDDYEPVDLPTIRLLARGKIDDLGRRLAREILWEHQNETHLLRGGAEPQTPKNNYEPMMEG